jgi:hypothetical protein
MMRSIAAVFALGVAGVACSAQYEIGRMDLAATGGSSTGGSAAGGAAVGMAGSGSAGAGLGVFSPQCIRTGPAPQPTGELATPDVVWERISTFIWGGAHLPPQTLPEQTSYEWAGEVVDQAFAQALDEVNGVPGATYFVKRWAGIADAEEALEGDYDSQLARDTNVVLEVLLQSSWAPGHAGVFSETAWLERHRGIPQRGRGVVETVFARAIPPPPEGIDFDLDPGIPDREAMEASVGYNQPCVACHQIINPVGYALGHFDRAGQYRELDHDQAIDTTGELMVDEGQISFDGIADFGAKAADTCEANRALVDGFLRVALTGSNDLYGPAEGVVEANRDGVRQQFVTGGRSYSALVKAYAQSALVLKP